MPLPVHSQATAPSRSASLSGKSLQHDPWLSWSLILTVSSFRFSFLSMCGQAQVTRSAQLSSKPTASCKACLSVAARYYQHQCYWFEWLQLYNSMRPQALTGIPSSLTIKLCHLPGCIQSGTCLPLLNSSAEVMVGIAGSTMQLRCTSNLAKSHSADNVTISLSTSSDSTAVTDQYGWTIVPDDTPTSVTWLGATRDLYASGKAGGA